MPENRSAQTFDGHCGPLVKDSGFYTLVIL